MNTFYYSYKSTDFIEQNIELLQCVEQIEAGYFTPDQPDALKDVANSLRFYDRFHVCADYADYIRCQEKVSETYKVWKLIFIKSLCRLDFVYYG